MMCAQSALSLLLFTVIYCYLLLLAIIHSGYGSKMNIWIQQSEFKVHDPTTCDDIK